MAVTVGQVTFTGDMPCELPPALTATASPVEGGVELSFLVRAPEQPNGTILIRERLRLSEAEQFFGSLAVAIRKAQEGR
jgi:hypothetical protein